MSCYLFKAVSYSGEMCLITIIRLRGSEHPSLLMRLIISEIGIVHRTVVSEYPVQILLSASSFLFLKISLSNLVL